MNRRVRIYTVARTRPPRRHHHHQQHHRRNRPRPLLPSHPLIPAQSSFGDRTGRKLEIGLRIKARARAAAEEETRGGPTATGRGRRR